MANLGVSPGLDRNRSQAKSGQAPRLHGKKVLRTTRLACVKTETELKYSILMETKERLIENEHSWQGDRFFRVLMLSHKMV